MLSSLGKKLKQQFFAKSVGIDLQSLDFIPSLAKPEIGKEVGRQRAHSQDDKVK